MALPYYGSVARAPDAVFFGEGVFVLTQATTRYPLTHELVEDLRAQPWALAVSPEVYAFVVLGGEAVVVRGVEPAPFLALEGVTAPPPEGAFLLAGHRLADRLGLKPGDPLLLPGSTRPLLLEATVDALLPAEGAAGDELVMDLPRARTLAGLGPAALTLVRVQVADGGALRSFLAAKNAEVLVGGEGRTERVEDGRLVDDRIGALILTRPELGVELGRGFVGTFAQHSGHSLQVVVLGLQGLTASLLAVILGSSLARYWLEGRREVGLLRALGGGGRALLAVFGTRLLAGGLAVGLAGVALGVAVGLALEAALEPRLFGHALRYPTEPAFLLTAYGLYAVAFLAALLLSLLFLLRQPPRDLLTEPPAPHPATWEEAGP